MVEPSNIEPTDIKPTDIGPTQSQGIGQPRESRCPKCGGHLSEIPSSQPLLDGRLPRAKHRGEVRHLRDGGATYGAQAAWG